MARNQTIDIAKGVGILLVVLGHTWMVLHDKGELFRVIYSFHMPLFFLLAGVFFKATVPFSKLVAGRADVLLKPYFVTFAALGVVYYLVKRVDVADYVFGILYSTGRSIPWAPLWFLTHLFVLSLASWLLVRILAKLGAGPWRKLLALTALLATGITVIRAFWERPAVLFGYDFELSGLPFSIDLLPVTLPFFLLGFYLRDQILRFRPTAWPLLSVLAVFIGGHWFFDKTIDLNLRIYDGYLVPTLVALAGIYLALAVSWALTHLRWPADTLALIGNASLIILIFSEPVQHKTFALTTLLLGEQTNIGSVVAFVMGSLLPVGIWLLMRRMDWLALLFLPLKSNQLYQRVTRA